MITYIKGVYILFSLFVFSIIMEGCCPKENNTFDIEIIGVEAVIDDYSINIADSLGIKVSVLTEKDHSIAQNFNFSNLSLFNKSYALQCIEYNNYQNFISSIHITSNANFDSTHLAGTPLNEIFDGPINDLTELQSQYEDGYYGYSYLKVKPTIDSLHTFYITLKTSDDKIYRDTIEDVLFLDF